MKKTSFPVSRLVAALGLALGVAGAAHAAVETTRVIVSFKPGSTAARMARAAIAKAGGHIKLEIDGENVAVVLPKAAVAALQKHSAVALIEEDAKRYPLSLTSPSGPGSSSGRRSRGGAPRSAGRRRGIRARHRSGGPR